MLNLIEIKEKEECVGGSYLLKYMDITKRKYPPPFTFLSSLSENTEELSCDTRKNKDRGLRGRVIPYEECRDPVSVVYDSE